MLNKFTSNEIEEFIKKVYDVVENNKNEPKTKIIELIKSEVERRVVRK